MSIWTFVDVAADQPTATPFGTAKARTFEIPAGAYTTPFWIRFDDGHGVRVDGLPFSMVRKFDRLQILYFDPEIAPTITSISPSSGSTTGGDTIRITMSAVLGTGSVTIGGVAATIVAASSGVNGYLDVIVPAGTSGAKNVVVADYHATPATSVGGFTYTGGVPLTAGSYSASAGDNTVALSAGTPTGGTAPYSVQHYRKTGAGAYAALTGAITNNWNDDTAVNGTAYTYKAIFSDSGGSTPVNSAERTVTPGSFAAPDIASTDFESGNSGLFLSGVPPTNMGSSVINFQADPTGELTGTVARMKYASGAGDGVKAVDVKLKFTHATGYGLGTTFYFRGHVVVPTPASDMLNGQRKLFYIQTQSNGPDAFFFLKAEPAIPGGQTLKLEFPKFPTGNMAPSAGSIQFNTKHSIEVQITVNSTTAIADGIIRVWVDGVLTFEKLDAYPMRTTARGNFKVFCFGDQCQASLAADIAFDEYRYWDNLAISTQRIGPG
jgi:hypothetical protein